MGRKEIDVAQRAVAAAQDNVRRAQKDLDDAIVAAGPDAFVVLVSPDYCICPAPINLDAAGDCLVCVARGLKKNSSRLTTRS